MVKCGNLFIRYAAADRTAILNNGWAGCGMLPRQSLCGVMNAQLMIYSLSSSKLHDNTE